MHTTVLTTPKCSVLRQQRWLPQMFDKAHFEATKGLPLMINMLLDGGTRCHTVRP